MKKIIGVVVALTLAVCVAVIAPHRCPAQESLQAGGLARLVPENAVFFKSSVDLDKLWGDVVASNFWKQLTSLKVWDETGARAGLENFGQEFAENMGFKLSRENIMSLVGKEIAVALCVEPGESPKIQGYLLCRTNPKSTAEDIVRKAWKVISEEADEAEFKESSFKGTRISSVKSTEVPFQAEHGFIGDVFALGIANTSPGLQTIIDLAGGTGKPLAENARFKKILEATRMTTGRHAGCFYGDMQKLGQIFAAMEGGDLPMPVQAMVSGMKQSFSTPMVVGGNGYIDRGLVMRMVALPTGDVSDELMQLSLATQPAAGSNLNYVPEGAVAYAGVNSMPDVQRMWPLLLKQWEEQGAMPAMNMIFQQIETALGITIAEDVIPWVGSELAVLGTDIDTKGGFPYPKFAIMLKVKDKQKANAFLQKLNSVIQELTEETGFKFERFSHEGNALRKVAITMPMPMPIALTPAYGVVDDFLVVSSSEDLIKQMIDTAKGAGKDLASNAAFKALNIPARTNSAGFLNWKRSMDVVKAVGAWAVQVFQAQPMMADSVKEAVDNYVVPIANCLAALETVGGYQINDGRMSVATYIIRVKDLPAR